MIKLTVLFGYPTDPAVFEDYYANTHLPLSVTMKGFEKAELTNFSAHLMAINPPITGWLNSGLKALKLYKLPWDHRKVRQLVQTSPTSQQAVLR